MPDEFFRGTTQAGRELRLFFEHTAYETFTDHAGETVDDPSETRITATLDGAPITVDALSRNSGAATVRSGELGTFTATNTDYAEDHHEALRRYLERCPSDGWEVALVEKRKDDEGLLYMAAITNGRLTERAAFRLSDQVARKLAGGNSTPSDAQVEAAIADTVKRDSWDKIKRRAERPTTLLWRAY